MKHTRYKSARVHIICTYAHEAANFTLMRINEYIMSVNYFSHCRTFSIAWIATNVFDILSLSFYFSLSLSL